MTRAALCLFCSVVMLATATPASAKGRHISCQFSGSINRGIKGDNASVDRTLNFFLDDTHSQLVGEGGDLPQGTILFVRTKTYSDTQIDAEISTGVVDGSTFFGQITDGPVVLRINRVAGSAVYAARLLPHGAEVAMGPCHEVAEPAARF